MALRDSQDLTLVVEQPTAKVRDSQDLALVVVQPSTRQLRVSQDVTLAIVQRIWFGSEATTLPHLTASGTGTFQANFSGTASVGLRSLAVSGAGTFQNWIASGAVTLRHVTTSADGTSIDNAMGTAAITLSRVTPSASGSVGAPASYTSTAAVTLPHVTASATGILSETCTVAATLKHITVSAAGLANSMGHVTLPHLTVSGTGNLATTGTAAVTLKHVVPAGIGTAFFTYGSLAATLKHLTASATGSIMAPGNITHNVYWKYKTDDLKVAWVQSYQGSRQIQISRRVLAGAVNQSFPVVLTEATTIALSLYSSQDVTLTVNAQTFNMLARQSLIWATDSLEDYPFDADVSTILVSNFGASPATFIVSALVLDASV